MSPERDPNQPGPERFNATPSSGAWKATGNLVAELLGGGLLQGKNITGITWYCCILMFFGELSQSRGEKLDCFAKILNMIYASIFDA